MSGHKTRAVFDRKKSVNEDDVRDAAKRMVAARDGRSSVAVLSGAKLGIGAPPITSWNRCEKWRARQGTILQPLGSKPNALSN